jgi:hypothetical protein
MWLDLPTPSPLRLTARALKVKPEWLRDEALAGRVPCLRAGDDLLFNLNAVRAVLAERAAEERLSADGSSTVPAGDGAGLASTVLGARGRRRGEAAATAAASTA